MSNETYPFTISITEDECEYLQRILSQSIEKLTGYNLTEQAQKQLAICESLYAKIS